MQVDFKTYNNQDTDVDVNLIAQNDAERALIAALASRDVTTARIAAEHKLIIRFEAEER